MDLKSHRSTCAYMMKVTMAYKQNCHFETSFESRPLNIHVSTFFVGFEGNMRFVRPMTTLLPEAVCQKLFFSMDLNAHGSQENIV